MPDITIVKLKIRRGTDSQRKSVVLEQGELGYATDTQRVFVGNGVVYGGTPVGSVIHPPTIIPNNRINQAGAQTGDLIYDNSILWQLSGTEYNKLSSWTNIGPRGDETYIGYDGNNKLTLKAGSIGADKLGSSVVYSQGGLDFNQSQGLSANIDTNYLRISSNKITINSISADKISSKALGNGLQGGDGTVLTLNVDTDLFGFTSNFLTLTALPTNVVTVNSLSSTFVGTGLQIQGGGISTVIQTYDSNSFVTDVNTLRLKPVITGGATSFSNVSYNNFGQISAVNSAISDTLSGVNVTTNTIFNGRWNQTTFTNQTLLTAVSSSPSGSTARTTLTSAGYMSVQTALGLFAIPIFKYN